MQIRKLLKKEIILSFVSILLVILSVAGISYAIFMEEDETDQSTIKFGDIAMTYNSTSRKIGYDASGNPVKLYPQTQAQALATTPYSFTLTNTGTLDLYVTIYLEKDTTFTPTGDYADYTDIESGNVYYAIGENGSDNKVELYTSTTIKSVQIPAGTSRTYNLWTWLKSDAPNTAQGAYFVANIRARGEFFPEGSIWAGECPSNPNSLNCSILADNPEYTTQTVANDTMFASAATTDEGLWTENRAGKTEGGLPVYFYRGDIDNNYVSFAGKMWRIVRINEDGSVKLILGGNTTTDGYGGTTTKYNPSYSLAEYVDYNHANNALRVANEDWYTNDTKGNLDEYESYIADIKFCNDKSVAGTAGSEIYYRPFGRISGYTVDGNWTSGQPITPQYKCPNASDNYIYKIGALTADEVAYAGGLRGSNNASYYLYDNAQSSGYAGYWWLLSPSSYNSGYAYVFIVFGSLNPGYLNYYSVYFALGFRPVVSLKSDTLILQGDGKFDSPYVITE